MTVRSSRMPAASVRVPAVRARSARLRSLFAALQTVARVRALLTLRGLDRAMAFAGDGFARHAAGRARSSGNDAVHGLHHDRVVAWSVAAASRLVPGASCLTQALAGQRLLAERGLGSRVRIGVRPDEGGGFFAHAWLLRGDHVLLGGAESMSGHATIREIVLHGAEKPLGGTEKPLGGMEEPS